MIGSFWPWRNYSTIQGFWWAKRILRKSKNSPWHNCIHSCFWATTASLWQQDKCTWVSNSVNIIFKIDAKARLNGSIVAFFEFPLTGGHETKLWWTIFSVRLRSIGSTPTFSKKLKTKHGETISGSLCCASRNRTAIWKFQNEVVDNSTIRSNLDWKRSSGWLESWEGLLFATDVSTTCAAVIFRVANNSRSQDSNHPDYLFQPRYVTPGFKTTSYWIRSKYSNDIPLVVCRAIRQMEKWTHIWMIE